MPFFKKYDDSELREQIDRLSVAVADLRHCMDQQVLRYEELYELARRNLAKMARRAVVDGDQAEPPPADNRQVRRAKAREALVARKLGR